MARKLAANVYVGETLYRAGTSPEKEIADQITNPKAWGEDEDGNALPDVDTDADGDDAPAPAKKTAAKRPAASK